jgi:hypothetical protein
MIFNHEGWWLINIQSADIDDMLSALDKSSADDKKNHLDTNYLS